MPGTGVQLAFNVLHTGVFQALDGAAHALALFAHRVGVTGKEEQRQVFGHFCKEGRVVQAQDAAEHAVVGVQCEGKGAALVRQIFVHLGGVAVEPVVGGAALQPLIVAQKRGVRHKIAAVVPAMKDRQHPAEGLGKLHQRFGLEAGAHDDGSIQLMAVFAQILPGIKGTHAVAQQEIGHPRVKLFGAHRHGVQVGQHGAVAVRLGKIAVIVPGADGAAMTQMVVAGDQNAPPGKVFCQRLIPVDELHHAVGQLQNGFHLAVRHAAEGVQRPPRHGGRDGEIDHLAHGRASFLRFFTVR